MPSSGDAGEGLLLLPVVGNAPSAAAPTTDAADDSHLPLTDGISPSSPSKCFSMLQAATDGKEPGRTTRASIRKQTGPVKKDEKGKESGIALEKTGRGASEKATVKGTLKGKGGGRGRGRGGKAGARGRDAGEELELEPEPEPETEASAPEADDNSDSVVVRFISGSAFDMNSIVSIIPATPIKNMENNEFQAKVIKYRSLIPTSTFPCR